MLLAALLVAPLAAALLTAFASGKDADAGARLSLVLAFGIAVLGLPLLCTTPAPFDVAWFRLYGTPATVHLSLASDGLSAWLVQLATWITPLAILGARRACGARIREFAVAVLAMESLMIGALLARDLVVFYLCFEGMLLPMAVLIALFGGQERRSAVRWFMLMTLLGSVPMVVAIWYLAHRFGTTDLAGLVQGLRSAYLGLDGLPARPWLFAALILAFAVKVPLVPLHAWQARTYGETPGPAAALLAGVMAKLGLYGLLRIAIPFFPEQAHQHADLFIALGLAGTVGGALVALAQDDAKRMVAYSSLSHLGLVVVGIFTFGATAAAGAAVQMVAHGLSVGAMFLLIGAIEARAQTCYLDEFGGLAHRAPVLAVMFTIAALATAGLPGTANFAGELLLLWGVWQTLGFWPAMIAGLSVILTAGYVLVLVQRWFYAKPAAEARALPDLSAGEVAAVLPLLAASLVLGFHATPVARSAGADCAALVASARDWKEPDTSRGPDAIPMGGPARPATAPAAAPVAVPRH